MANEEHLNILKQGVAIWNKWQREHLRIKPDFSGAALARMRLRGVVFRGANLTGIFLRQSDLTGANFSAANLTSANLSGANLTSANFDESDLRGANLNGSDLNKANLRGANLNKVDLGGANLNGTNLRGADMTEAALYGLDLRGADLSEMKLSKANLNGTNLSKANLGRANLSGTQLINADFTGARLTGANLSGSKLNGADLSYADLSGADFSRAIISSTTFSNVELQEVKNLETVQHWGPSEISVSTIYRSEGQIPEVFLRGCGVPESFIVQMQALVTAIQPIQFYSCFISYSHADQSFARRLHDALQGRGIRCWLDEHQMLPGQDIYDEVDRGIRLWDKVLLCCSKDSLTSWWVDDEITKAYEKEQALMKQRGGKVLALIPLNLDGYMFSGEWKSGKASQVKARLAADFTGWKRSSMKFDAQFERLVKALQTDGGRELPPQPKL